MNGVLTIIALLLGLAIVVGVPGAGLPAVLLCAGLALTFGLVLRRVNLDFNFLLPVFLLGLFLRLAVGTGTFVYKLQEFFGGDANTYDKQGFELLRYWQGHGSLPAAGLEDNGIIWGMPYLVAGIYALTGRNMLAVQFVNAVVGAATVLPVYLCARHIFQNARVARVSALLVAFFPSLVLWSSQGLKDGPIMLLLAIAMLATLKLGERLSLKYFVVLVLAMLGLLTLRFYVFYMVAAAVGGSFLIGMREVTTRSMARQFVLVVAIGLALTQFGVLSRAGTQLQTFGTLEAVQRARMDQAQQAESGFGRDVNVSTTTGALSAIPVGLVYLMFAPFPWEVTNLRQTITLPEMLVWWALFPLLVLGSWFTLKYRLRPALPILLFTTLLTLAYSIFQGNVGTAYRQRAQLLIFYFMFIAVGLVLLKERSEARQQQQAEAAQLVLAHAAAGQRYKRWKRQKEKELEAIAEDLIRELGF